MKYIKKSLLVMLTLFVAMACEDEDKSPIVTFDSAEKGAYVRQLSQSGGTLINILTEADFNASSFSYGIDFIDGNAGNNIAEYIVKVEYVDLDGTNSAGPSELRRYSSSEFGQSADGNMGIDNVSVTSADVTGVFGLNFADLAPGDKFEVSGEIVTNSGQVFTGSNSSTTIEGDAFQGFFDFTMPAACPSDLTGTFSYATTDSWCNGNSVDGDVEIKALGGGTYTFSDFSFGAYSQCYSATSVANQPTVNFTEVCAEVAFTGFVDSYGDTWTFVSSIDGESWNIEWSNTYNESGKTVITFPGGVPFTLAP